MSISQIRQGRDWSTSRESIAEILSTLDLMHDFCVLQEAGEDFTLEQADSPLLSNLHLLCNRLTSEAAVASADTIARNKHGFDFPQSWAYFEMTRCLKDITAKIPTSSDNIAIQTSNMVPHIKKMKFILRQLDQ